MWPFRPKTKKTAAPDAEETEMSASRREPPKKKAARGTRSEPKYGKPKILLVDLPDSCSKALLEAGYNVKVGTFGTPYKVERDSGLRAVSLDSCNLPGLQEQEIIIASTRCNKAAAEPSQGKEPVQGVPCSWQTTKWGLIDPRPLFMARVAADVRRIRQHGGVVVVLVAERYGIEYPFGELRGRSVDVDRRLRHTNWSFAPDLNAFETTGNQGEEIAFGDSDLARCLKRAARNATYSCTLEPDYDHKKNWLTLAKNKYGEDVAGALVYGKEGNKEVLLALPQMPALHTIVVELVESWCAQWSPSLFPHLSRLPWLHKKTYEIPRVCELSEEMECVEAEAKSRVDELQGHIEQIRKEESDWYDLLSGTGERLVAAVIKSLGRVGFKKVVDVDKERKDKGEDRDLREDVQVNDRSPALVVDVKGVTGRPDDDESRQSEKHATLRMREWERTDVQPLTIINSQRHLPPHERDLQAYRQEMIDYAEHHQMGLMTTYDIFRLLRNREKYEWPDDRVLPVFYRTGRIDPVPEHYAYVGNIVKVWKPAFGVVPSSAVQVGTILAVETDIFFEEFKVPSLMVDDQAVEEARPGSNCGVAFDGASDKLREGMRVFLVEGAKDAAGASE